MKKQEDSGGRWALFLKAIRETPEEKAPAGFEAGVRARIRDGLGHPVKPGTRWSIIPKIAWAAAAVFLVGFPVWRLRPAGDPAVRRAAPLPLWKEVSFRFDFSEAQSVALVGDFNGWDAKAHPLRKDASGLWTASIKVEPGSYQYQFVVNGERFMADPANPVRIADGFGGMNSGVEI